MAGQRSFAIGQFELPRWGLRLSERRALLFAGDLACALLATALSLWLWTLTSGSLFSLDYLRDKAQWFFVLVPAWMVLNLGQYDLGRAAFPQTTLAGLLSIAGLVLLAYLGVYFLAPRGALPRLLVLYFVLLVFSLQLSWRMLYIRVFVSSFFRRRALVVGAGWAGEAIIQAVAQFHAWQYDIIGIIDDDPAKHGRLVGGVPVLGGHDRLLEVARRGEVSELILAITGEVHGGLFQALLDCQANGLPLVRVLRLYEQITGRVPIEHLEADWVMTAFVERVRFDAAFVFAKRAIDLIGGVIGLAALLLLLPFIALAIWLESRGPVFYTQVRLGRGGQPFQVWKFRTMVAEAEADGQARWAAVDDERVTRVGRILRRMRLDELPQFWNVVTGEMSLVGPRPERPEMIAILEQHIPFYRARLLVKPGLTGWAQINYGYGSSIDDALAKLQYDLYYIKHQAGWLDLTIITRTVEVVLGMKGT